MSIDRLCDTAKHILQKLQIFWKPRACMLLVVLYLCGAALSTINTSSALVTIVESGKKSTVFTFNKNADDILNQAGVNLNDVDKVSFEGIVGGRGVIRINRRKNVYIETNGTCTSYTVPRSSTVGEILETADIKAVGEDEVNYPAHTCVPANTVIRVKDVSYITKKKNEKLSYADYKDLVQRDPSLEKYRIPKNTKVVVTTTYKYRLVDGTLDSARIIARKAKAYEVKYSDEVKSVSALKPAKPILLNKKGVPVNYSKKISGNASAYTAYKGARTSTGKVAQTGYVAVNPKQIPYGTKLYIVSKDGRYNYGYAIAADTGGFIHWGTRVVDLYFNSTSECRQFGVRGVDIYVLD